MVAHHPQCIHRTCPLSMKRVSSGVENGQTRVKKCCAFCGTLSPSKTQRYTMRIDIGWQSTQKGRTGLGDASERPTTTRQDFNSCLPLARHQRLHLAQSLSFSEHSYRDVENPQLDEPTCQTVQIGTKLQPDDDEAYLVRETSCRAEFNVAQPLQANSSDLLVRWVLNR